MGGFGFFVRWHINLRGYLMSKSSLLKNSSGTQSRIVNKEVHRVFVRK